MAAKDWHAHEADAAVAALASHAEAGLGHDEAARRLATHGPNSLPEAAARPAWRVFVRQFASPLIYLLFGAAAVAFAVGHRTDGIVIVVVVAVNALIGAFQEGRAERSLAALRRLTQVRARVVRGGQHAMIESHAVVPGDVLLLEAGDAVVADARLVHAPSLQVAEAALTGESVPVAKAVHALPADAALADRHNMVHAGTLVTAGRGRALVVGTGTATEIGRIAALTQSAVVPPTPLERRIAQFGRMVMVGALGLFVVVLGVGLLRGIAFGPLLMIGISQLVGMIPEGLPVAMTIALAVGVQRMARRRAVVRRLSAVETLGSTTVICTDKTGTLTRNEMTVTAVVLGDGRVVDVDGAGYEPLGTFRAGARVVDAAAEPALVALAEAALLCNDARLAGPLAEAPAWRPVGDPTEVALVTLARKAGVEPAALAARHPRRAELPFDPAAKLMATGHDDGRGGAFIVVKGAPEEVLAICGAVRRGAGAPSDVVLDEAGRQAVSAAAQDLAARALRVLAVAVVDGATLDPAAGFAGLAGRATLLGLVGQLDPPRPEVKDAIVRCRRAGIRTVMVTGDHKATGQAIARTLGLAGDGDLALDGRELEALGDDELAACIDRVTVFARVHPAQKLRIVDALQRRGEVVAMTGDGVNDAPALTKADVGVAMGVSGTEVAKDAAKIVLADDNFATIVAAVEEGRVVRRNLEKSILLLFSTSAAEVVVLLGAMILGFPPPFSAVMILWNNLVTEGLVTINLVMEPAEGDEMDGRPIASDQPLLSRGLLVRMTFMVPTISAVTLGWFVWRTSAGVAAAQVSTEAFTLLALCEWFNVLSCRSATRSALSLGVLGNPWLVGGLVLGNLLQVGVVFWAPLAGVFGTAPFGLGIVVELGLVASLVLWVEEARKLVVRRRTLRLPRDGRGGSAKP